MGLEDKKTSSARNLHRHMFFIRPSLVKATTGGSETTIATKLKMGVGYCGNFLILKNDELFSCALTVGFAPCELER